ncbi:hypothetical protein CMO89_00425 [Candidatus Woesearchaeota archaeon]|jgi:CBS domain-containing protein|nr:hypothetical protein [Candidatus Woesearchaeota archaeon]|tara:strand:+ start:8447 stop:8995 length:549 start_codon:yes stop_codon:yes gene_type:complete
MKTGYKVCDAMTEKVIYVRPTESLETCAKIMKDNDVGALIIKEEEKVSGIMTEKDIVRKMVAEGLNPLKKQIKDIMETNITSISPEKDIFEALILMRDTDVRHLPVMDDNRLVGILTLNDILKIEPQLFDILVEKIELREEERKPISNLKEKEGVCQTCGEYSEELTNKDSVLMCEKCGKES